MTVVAVTDNILFKYDRRGTSLLPMIYFVLYSIQTIAIVQNIL